jgi:predicted metal-dependent peptidase
MSQEEIDSLKNDIKEAIISSFQTCQAGEVPLGVDRLIDSLTKPKLDWRDVIRQSIQSKIKYDFTFQRPNKRSFHTGIYMPSMDFEQEIEVAIAFDMSGSISDSAASAFLSEVNGIINDFTSWNIKIWSFDTEVYNYREYSSNFDNSILEYKPKGGGGTSFEANWNFMKKEQINPKLFIMFTDMYPSGGWGDPNYCDTLFIAHNNKNTIAPFGETIAI